MFGSRVLAIQVGSSVFVLGVLVAVWANTPNGYFWPAWVLGGWGAGLVLHAWDVFVHSQITDADIDAELRRHRG